MHRVRFCAKSRGPKDSLYFILGLDAFLDIGSWKEFEVIFSLCHFSGPTRPGCEDSLSLVRMPVAVRRLFCYDRREKFYRHKSGTKLYFFKLTDIAISASDIRNRVKEGKSIRYLVPLRASLPAAGGGPGCARARARRGRSPGRPPGKRPCS